MLADHYEVILANGLTTVRIVRVYAYDLMDARATAEQGHPGFTAIAADRLR